MTVIEMIHHVRFDDIKRMFKRFTDVYGNAWSNRHNNQDDWAHCEQTWLECLSRFEIKVLYAAVKDYFAVSKIFPPTLLQLEELCEKYHSPRQTLEQISEEFKPTKPQLINFTESYREMKTQATELKKDSAITIPTFDKKKINPKHPLFDLQMYEERKTYLLSLSENQAINLDRSDWYDRSRLLREIEAKEQLIKVARTVAAPRGEIVEPKRNFIGSKHVYKDWMN